MNHFPEAWGRPRDDVYGAYDRSYLQTSGPMTHTQRPIVTGTSVIAVKFKDGVVIAADNLASYGSLARFTDVKRLRAFDNSSVVGFGGDVSDMQYIDRVLNSLDIQENYSTYGEHSLNAKNLHTYLSKLLYKRRSDFDPLWNHILVAGLDGEGKPFLSSADLLGTTYSAPSLATGFGAHLAIPILRRLFPEEDGIENITKEQAIDAMKQCMKVLFYRDARSSDRYSIAVVTKEGVELKEDEALENQSWAFADRIRGYGTQVN
ncbi:Proteasome subunit beta type-7 [Microsporum canis]